MEFWFTATVEQASTAPSGKLPTSPVCLGNAEVILPIQHPLTVLFIEFILEFFKMDVAFYRFLIQSEIRSS